MGTMDDLLATALDTALVAGTSAFAAWLETNKQLEPDHTWLEVVGGVSACLIYASLYSRVTRGNHERAVWRAFALGGTPIIVGELAQWRERLKERQKYQAERARRPVYIDLTQ